MPKAHLSILPTAQKELWETFQQNWSTVPDNRWYLAGGTGLALQTGHRESVDFDFFTQSPSIRIETETWLNSFASCTVRDADAHTLHGSIQDVKCSFIGNYKYPLVEKTEMINAIPVASILDIALMKLLAISHRSTVRDYIDIALILRDSLPLQTIVSRAGEKYGETFDPIFAVRLLTAFDDLDTDIPRVFDADLEKNWQKILRTAVSELIL
jgi:hypothetical protein